MSDRPKTEFPIPELMGRMAAVLGVDPGTAFDRTTMSEAADRCANCTNVTSCREWLELAAIRGAEHPPTLCANHDVFETAGQIETI